MSCHFFAAKLENMDQIGTRPSHFGDLGSEIQALTFLNNALSNSALNELKGKDHPLGSAVDCYGGYVFCAVW